MTESESPAPNVSRHAQPSCSLLLNRLQISGKCIDLAQRFGLAALPPEGSPPYRHFSGPVGDTGLFAINPGHDLICRKPAVLSADLGKIRRGSFKCFCCRSISSPRRTVAGDAELDVDGTSLARIFVGFIGG